jgi:hypothetical protein
MTTERPDLYAILGATPTALLRRHPDTRAPADQSHGALSDAALQQVLAAYAMLRDPAAEPTTTGKSGSAHIQHPSDHSSADKYGAHGQPPITAGPVRWHRTPDPPPRRPGNPRLATTQLGPPAPPWWRQSRLTPAPAQLGIRSADPGAVHRP